MNLSSLPTSHLLASSGLCPVGSSGSSGTSGGARLDATKASNAQFALPSGALDGGTLHISPHDPSWTLAQYEDAFVAALCAQQDGQR